MRKDGKYDVILKSGEQGEVEKEYINTEQGDKIYSSDDKIHIVGYDEEIPLRKTDTINSSADDERRKLNIVGSLGEQNNMNFTLAKINENNPSVLELVNTNVFVDITDVYLFYELTDQGYMKCPYAETMLYPQNVKQEIQKGCYVVGVVGEDGTAGKSFFSQEKEVKKGWLYIQFPNEYDKGTVIAEDGTLITVYKSDKDNGSIIVELAKEGRIVGKQQSVYIYAFDDNDASGEILDMAKVSILPEPFWVGKEDTYAHIINPETGTPGWVGLKNLKHIEMKQNAIQQDDSKNTETFLVEAKAGIDIRETRQTQKEYRDNVKESELQEGDQLIVKHQKNDEEDLYYVVFPLELEGGIVQGDEIKKLYKFVGDNLEKIQYRDEEENEEPKESIQESSNRIFRNMMATYNNLQQTTKPEQRENVDYDYDKAIGKCWNDTKDYYKS